MKNVKLEDICNLISKGSTPRGKLEYSKNEKYNFLRVTDMIDLKTISNSEYTMSELEIKNYKMKLWPKNTILISIEGTVGKISMLGQKMCFNQAVAGLVVNEGEVNPLYLMYYLKATMLFNRMIKGTIMPALRLGDIANIEITLPNMNIQNKIVSILSKITDKIDENTVTNNNLLLVA